MGVLRPRTRPRRSKRWWSDAAALLLRSLRVECHSAGMAHKYIHAMRRAARAVGSARWGTALDYCQGSARADRVALRDSDTQTHRHGYTYLPSRFELGRAHEPHEDRAALTVSPLERELELPQSAVDMLTWQNFLPRHGMADG